MESLAVKRDSDKKTSAEKKIPEFNYFNPQLFFSLTFNKAYFRHLTNVNSLFDEGGTKMSF